jgi:hypothetical protein
MSFLFLSEESDCCRNQITLVERNKANQIIFLLEISSSCRLAFVLFCKTFDDIRSLFTQAIKSLVREVMVENFW